MLCFWAAKGGAGTTTTAAGTALTLAAGGEPVLLVDLAGAMPEALGTAQPEAGVAEWAAQGEAVPVDGLDRLRRPVTTHLHLLGRGAGPLDPARADALAGLLAVQPGTVVVDAGSAPGPFARTIVESAARSILVVRPCYLGVAAARATSLRPTGIAVVREPQRALRPGEIAEALGAPLAAVVRHDPGVARAVDAGLLAHRLPAALRRAGQVLAA